MKVVRMLDKIKRVKDKIDDGTGKVIEVLEEVSTTHDDAKDIIEGVKEGKGGKRVVKKGYLFEIRCRKQLEKDGYLVIRSAGSKGVADLVAVGNERIVFVDIKRKEGVSAREREPLEKFVKSAKGFKVAGEFWRLKGEDIAIYPVSCS